MSYTTEKQPQGMPINLANFLREAAIGELVAINGYQNHIANCNLLDVKKILEHIVEDEKKHFGMLLHLIRKCDPDQFKIAVKVHEEISMKSKSLSEHNEKKKNHDFCLLEKIREDIKGEFEAIIAYEDTASKITDKEAINMIKEIVLDEKEHVEELTYIVLRLDNNCYGPLEKEF